MHLPASIIRSQTGLALKDFSLGCLDLYPISPRKCRGGKQGQANMTYVEVTNLWLAHLDLFMLLLFPFSLLAPRSLLFYVPHWLLFSLFVWMPWGTPSCLPSMGWRKNMKHGVHAFSPSLVGVAGSTICALVGG